MVDVPSLTTVQLNVASGAWFPVQQGAVVHLWHSLGHGCRSRRLLSAMSSGRAFKPSRSFVPFRYPLGAGRARNATHVAHVAEPQFTSIIPEVLEEIELDGDYQAMVQSTLAQGQAALTQVETAKRQAVLKATGIRAWSQKMEACMLSLVFSCSRWSWTVRDTLRHDIRVQRPLQHLHCGSCCSSQQGPSDPCLTCMCEAGRLCCRKLAFRRLTGRQPRFYN